MLISIFCQLHTPASPDRFGGISRNFQVFDPLDFIADLTQHIPDKGEHLIRYYGHYSNKARKGCSNASCSPGLPTGAAAAGSRTQESSATEP